MGATIFILTIVSAIVLIIIMSVQQSKAYKEGSIEMLDKLFDNDEISADVYKKYNKRLKENKDE